MIYRKRFGQEYHENAFCWCGSYVQRYESRCCRHIQAGQMDVFADDDNDDDDDDGVPSGPRRFVRTDGYKHFREPQEYPGREPNKRRRCEGKGWICFM